MSCSAGCSRFAGHASHGSISRPCIWGALVEFSGWICPLTPLENRLRRASGEAGYQGDFIAHYILPALYPEGLTRADQLVLGGIAIAINVAMYALVIVRHRRSAPKDI